MSTKELNNLARGKKKQADGHKESFADIKESIALYLESVCYFIKCAHDEQILDQRKTLLSATLSMLQHLIHNYEKMFYKAPIESNKLLLDNIRQRFLLINYWLQSFIYQLQYNANIPSLEPFVGQITSHFNNSKSPSDLNQNFLFQFSKYMLNLYYSNYYWNKAERLLDDESLKKYAETLIKQNQNRRITRDDTTIDFLSYIFDAIDLLRSISA